MANKIIVKKSSVAGKVPAAGDLEIGELAVNLTDQKLYSKNASGTVVQLGGGSGTGDVVGPASSTDNALVRFDGTTGKLVQNSGATLDDSGNLNTSTSKAEAFDFDTAATPSAAVGRIRWDDGNGTAQLGLKGGNVTLQIGEELVARVYNDSGVALTDGQIVYISGAQGNRIAVKLANASSEATSAGTLGMVTEPIAIGAEGFITIMGTVNGLNTSALTAGSLIYLSASTSGAYTTTPPTSPNHKVILGYVERVHATIGSIYVKVDNGYELDELHNVKITTPTNGQVLKYNGTTNVWENSVDSGGGGTEIPVNTIVAFPYSDSTITIGNQVWQKNTVLNAPHQQCLTINRVSYDSAKHDLITIDPSVKDYWTLISSPFTSGTPNSVCSTSSGFAAVSQNMFSTSADGITWSTPVIINASLSSGTIYYINGTFFYFSTTGNTSAISTDGVNWTYLSSGQPSSAAYGLEWTGTYYVTINTSSVSYSSNGTSWTTVSGKGGYGIVKAGSTYIIPTLSGVCRTSTDGITWVDGTIATTSESFQAIASDGTTAIVVGSRGSIYTTTNGASWSFSTTIPDAYTGSSGFRRIIATSTGTFYIFGCTGVYKTTDSGSTWSTVASSLTTNAQFAYYGGTFISNSASGSDLNTTGFTTSKMAYTNSFESTPSYINFKLGSAATFSSIVFGKTTFYMRTK